MIEWILPLIIQPSNTQFWKINPRIQMGIKAGRNKRNRKLLQDTWDNSQDKVSPPCTVLLERLYDTYKKQKKWDADNWIIACKDVKDIIADILIPGLRPGMADSEARGIVFEYGQSKSREPGVRIVIAPRQFQVKKREHILDV